MGEGGDWLGDESPTLIFTSFFSGEIEGVREAEGEGEGRRAVDCTSVLRSVLRKGTFRL